jgi:glycosyltransferase involved in cell wall biosynthesis
LAAFAEVPRKSIGTKLTIFADPSDNPTYWQEILFSAKSVGVQNAIVLQKPEELALHIQSIDILVLPSLVESNYQEVLFCWKNRVIPLVPRVSWARNLLDDTDWSTYNPYDYRNLVTQITRLAEDPFRTRNLAEENAKRSRDHYAPGQVIREYAKAYRQEVTAPSLAFLHRAANLANAPRG